MRKRLALVTLAIVAVTASVAAYYKVNGAEPAPQFVTAAVTRGAVVDAVEATGTLQAVTTVQVGTQVSGTIASLHADFNSEVKAGQVIARLDPSLMQAQIDQAQATVVRLQADADRTRVSYEDAQVKLRRARQLFAQGLIPAIDVENAEATEKQAAASVKAAQAQVTQAMGSVNQQRVNLNHSIIRAPVDGIVISRNVDVGQTVAASMSAPTLFVIARDLAQMQVNASIDESDIGRIEAGQSVSFRVDAYPDESFRGTVSQVRLEPVVTQNVVSYVTVIQVPNDELKLRPGMTANVTIEVARADGVLRVPNAALRFRPPQSEPGNPGASGDATAPAPFREGQARQRGPRVWTLQGGQLHAVRVETGLSDGTTTAVVGGDLDESAQVVTGVATAGTSASQTSATSPFLPQRPGGNRNANRQRTGAAR